MVRQLKEVADEVIKAHENNTDSDHEYDSEKEEVEILKSIKL